MDSFLYIVKIDSCVRNMLSAVSLAPMFSRFRRANSCQQTVSLLQRESTNQNAGSASLWFKILRCHNTAPTRTVFDSFRKMTESGSIPGNGGVLILDLYNESLAGCGKSSLIGIPFTREEPPKTPQNCPQCPPCIRLLASRLQCARPFRRSSCCRNLWQRG